MRDFSIGSEKFFEFFVILVNHHKKFINNCFVEQVISVTVVFVSLSSQASRGNRRVIFALIITSDFLQR